MISELLDLLLHVDQYLAELSKDYGNWLYGILFLIVFVETGLVIMPFLPGDSLLFAAGALAAGGAMNVWLVGILLIIAAIIGDSVNYAVGRYFRDFLAKGGRLRLVKQSHLDRTHAFFERYGGRAIIYARFVPIVRTMAPFCAGVGTMNYRRFLSYNVIGAIVWVILFLAAGYLFGEIPIVKKNFSLVILGIIFVSVLPIAYEWGKFWLAKRNAKPGTIKPDAIATEKPNADKAEQPSP